MGTPRDPAALDELLLAHQAEQQERAEDQASLLASAHLCALRAMAVHLFAEELAEGLDAAADVRRAEAGRVHLLALGLYQLSFNSELCLVC
jgi:hypothetical protein